MLIILNVVFFVKTWRDLNKIGNSIIKLTSDISVFKQELEDSKVEVFQKYTRTSLTKLEEDLKAYFFRNCDRSKNRAVCLERLAVFLKDEEMCFSGPVKYSLRDDCVKDVAIEKEDASLCERVSGNTTRLLCQAVVTNSAEICNALDLLAKHTCLAALSAKNKDASYCRLISDDYNRSICFQAMARELKDVSFCEGICEHSLDPKACLASKKTWIGDCYMQVAILSGNSEHCSRSTDDDDYNYCMALTTGDIKYCGKIDSSNIEWSENCYGFLTGKFEKNYEDMFGNKLLPPKY